MFESFLTKSSAAISSSGNLTLIGLGLRARLFAPLFISPGIHRFVDCHLRSLKVELADLAEIDPQRRPHTCIEVARLLPS